MMRALALIAFMPGVLWAGTASGMLVVDGQAIVMKYADAVQIPDWGDKTKTGTRLVISDVPVPSAALQDDIELMSLSHDGKVNAIQFEMGADKANLSMSILSNKVEGSLSSSRTFDAGDLTVFTDKHIEGALAIEEKKLGDTTYRYDVKFATDIAPRVVQTPPTAADTAAAAKAGSAQAYLAWVEAIRKGDKAKMLELASPEIRPMIDQPDFADGSRGDRASRRAARP